MQNCNGLFSIKVTYECHFSQYAAIGSSLGFGTELACHNNKQMFIYTKPYSIHIYIHAHTHFSFSIDISIQNISQNTYWKQMAQFPETKHKQMTYKNCCQVTINNNTGEFYVLFSVFLCLLWGRRCNWFAQVFEPFGT